GGGVGRCSRRWRCRRMPPRWLGSGCIRRCWTRRCTRWVRPAWPVMVWRVGRRGGRVVWRGGGRGGGGGLGGGAGGGGGWGGGVGVCGEGGGGARGGGVPVAGAVAAGARGGGGVAGRWWWCAGRVG